MTNQFYYNFPTGRALARHHSPGDGVVSVDAAVSDTAYVGRGAVVCPGARVDADAVVDGNVDVMGVVSGRVYGPHLGRLTVPREVLVPNGASILRREGGGIRKTPLVLRLVRGASITIDDTIIAIGCQRHTLAEWLKRYKELAEEYDYEALLRYAPTIELSARAHGLRAGWEHSTVPWLKPKAKAKAGAPRRRRAS